ncbi:DUF72 domain-containing protein [Halotalea alkalilenta]|uniref:DUF72 domain-containing protein n=1 Tax=Halotalea alkalilenta TaxID=376489 RepID=A0A172YAZ2_9GAMM|nr:DUF72 domain-containing protein [Halotalea alkalilenta]ANF56397.1 hypothetical protein A5892_02065 [Halotalea alkalilenta]
MVNEKGGRLHLGLAMWANSDWRGTLYGPHTPMNESLADYATVFSSVEGNTTFYSGAPKAETVAAWATLAPKEFRFCFKLPSRLTHERRLDGIESEFEAFIAQLSPLGERLGPIMVQLPRNFGGDELDKLARLLERWPTGVGCAVEPRDPAMFAKGEVEKEFNQLLITHGADRVMLDVRALFSTPADAAPSLAKAQSEKPKRPLHVISTANAPIVRFIGHADMRRNADYFTPWVERLNLWINQGKTPFLFVHTPDNKAAPWLARQCYQRIIDASMKPSDWPAPAAFPGERQNALF